MSPYRRVLEITKAAQTMEGGGFPVSRPFPVRGLRELDPFLLLDHMGPVNWPPGEAIGAPDHPHRGFETITYLLQGRMVHQDSSGHQAQIGPGDAQWMNAGSGVVHSEMPEEQYRRLGGFLEGFQLWVNLAAREKFSPPAYHDIPSDKIPQQNFEGGFVKLLAGPMGDLKGPAQTSTPIHYRHYLLEEGAVIETEITEDFETFCYLIKGSGKFGAEKAPAKGLDMVRFARLGSLILICNESPEPLEFLLLAGQPLGEPIARHGPFVMNSEKEIKEAFMDYQSGKMGSIKPLVD